MDRVIIEKKFTPQKVLKGAMVATLVVVGFLYLRWWLQPSVTLSEVRTAVVERGDLATGLRATGTVQPAVESSIASELTASIEKVYLEPGEVVKPGDLIMELDNREIQLELDRVGERLRQKESEKEQKALDFKRVLMEEDRNYEIETLEEAATKAGFQRASKLFEQGLVSVEEVDEKRLLWQKSGVKLKHIESARTNRLASHQTEIDQITAEIAVLQKEWTDAARRLERAKVTSDREGVLTSILNEPGSLVQKGEVLAQISDLSHFRVEASISDYYAKEIEPGQKVRVEINNMELMGSVSRVLPTVESGAVTMWVALDEPNHPVLRPALRVQSHVLTDFKSQILKVRKGPAFNGSGKQEIFVLDLQAKKAIRREVQLGGENHFEVEVLEGLEEGDQVILSDMPNHKEQKVLRIRS